MKKKKEIVEEVVFKSSWEIHVGDEIIEIKTESDARKRFRNMIGGDSNTIGYLYRNDYNEKGKLIETYMLA